MKNNKEMSNALLTWKDWSIELEQNVRVVLLKREYANKFFLTTMFNELK